MPDNWPTPKFQFEVIIDGQRASFTEVTGLNAETQVIEYRAGNSNVFSTVKMPGIQKFGNVTLKKGVFKSDSAVWNWLNPVKLNSVQRKTVVINLLDEAGGLTMSWTLSNAFPSKITTTDMKADGNEVAIEAIELTHEGLTIANK